MTVWTEQFAKNYRGPRLGGRPLQLVPVGAPRFPFRAHAPSFLSGLQPCRFHLPS